MGHAISQGRKALHALRGLVKLQALVRGHLVRKQTTATLRCMHALMAIQVRARIHRIQMQQESNLLREINKVSLFPNILFNFDVYQRNSHHLGIVYICRTLRI